LNLGVVGMFIQVAIDDGPGPTIKYQYPELNKLYAVISLLIRCCDVNQFCKTQVCNELSVPTVRRFRVS